MGSDLLRLQMQPGLRSTDSHRHSSPFLPSFSSSPLASLPPWCRGQCVLSSHLLEHCWRNATIWDWHHCKLRLPTWHHVVFDHLIFGALITCPVPPLTSGLAFCLLLLKKKNGGPWDHMISIKFLLLTNSATTTVNLGAG